MANNQNSSEQAQAGELYYTIEGGNGSMWEIFTPERGIYRFGYGEEAEITARGVCKVMSMERDALLRRLAGGVTVDDEVKEYLEGAYRHIANVSGSALLAGEKHDKEDKHLLYKEACRALCFVGNAYYRLTGNNPPLEAK